MSPVPADAVPEASSTGLSPATVLVLGGTGFIGRALLRHLCRAGYHTRVLVRGTSARAAALSGPGIEAMVGDFTDPARLDAALAGIHHVYHLARGEGNTWDDYQRNDVTPTRQLAERCAQRDIWLYYASSIAIYDGGRADEVVDERTPASPDALRMNAYARAKAENERMLATLGRERGLKYVIFRPGIVIGAGGSLHPAGVGTWPSEARCIPWGGGRQRLPFVLVDDCVDAMVRASQVDGLAGESFNLVGGVPLTGIEYLDALESATGITIRREPLPPWWQYTRSLAKWFALTLLGKASREAPTYRYFTGLVRHATFSAEHAKQRLGWSPNTDVLVLIDQGIRMAAHAHSSRPR